MEYASNGAHRVRVRLEEQVEAYYKGHIVVLRRMVQLTSDKTFAHAIL
jgi:hypothetical protein